MYNLPTELDLSFLVGLLLTQICVGQYQVILNFHEDVSISIEHSFTVVSEQKREIWLPQDVSSAASALKLLGMTTTSIERLPENGICLGFDGSFHMEISGDSDRYEAYQIIHPGQQIII